MKPLRTLLAALLVLPIGAWAGSLATQAVQGGTSVLQEVASAPPLETKTGYTCCWVFIFGRWYCVPC